MALEYDIYLATRMKPRQALDLLAGRIVELVWSEDGSCLFHETVTIRAAETLASRREALHEAFHFIPVVRVGFRFGSNTDYDEFKRLMFRATMLLLGHAQDAVLLFNGEIIVLQRFGGKLVFNTDYHMWDEDWLKGQLTVPFERRPLPSPLL